MAYVDPYDRKRKQDTHFLNQDIYGCPIYPDFLVGLQDSSPAPDF